MSEQKAIVKKERNVTDMVQSRVAQMLTTDELKLPSDYSYENACKSAWLTLQEVKDRNDKPALQVCTKESILNSLLDMVVQGLNPAKKQCYFVVYGKQLVLQRSYMGTVAVAKRFSDVKDVFAQVVYEGDDFEYEIDVMSGNKRITKHSQKLENVDINKIKAAYAVVHRADGEPFVEIMTIDQIKKAWGQGATKGASPAHKNFAEEMAKKSVINRACKLFVNTSNDNPILVDAFNRTTAAEYERSKSEVVIDVEDVEVVNDANDFIFGTGQAAEAEESSEASEDVAALTPEEIAEIEAAEAQEAQND